MLDFKQFIKQTLSLPLSSHKNMVGGLILGLSIVTASRGECVWVLLTGAYGLG